ncbi:MAG: O-antigen ligase family protein [Candidatus Hodarchaeota archaeon]
MALTRIKNGSIAPQGARCLFTFLVVPIIIANLTCLLTNINQYIPILVLLYSILLYLIVCKPSIMLSLFVVARVLCGPIEEKFTIIPGVLSLGGTLNIIVAALFLGVMIQASLGGIRITEKLRMIPYIRLYAIYLLSFGLSSLIASDHIWSLKLFSRSFSYFLIFLLIVILVDSDNRVVVLLRILKFTLIASFVGGMLQIVFGCGIPVYIDVAYPRYTSMFFLHPNDYANYLGYLFFPVFCVWYYTNKRVISVDFLLVSLTFASIVGTYSRAVWISFFVGLLVLLLILKRNWKVLSKILILGSLFAIIFWQPVVLRMSEVPGVRKTFAIKRYSSAAHFNTFGERLDRWNQVIDHFKRSGIKHFLIGYGTGSVRSTFQWSSHNNYVDILHDNGVIVLICYVTLLLLFFKTFLSESRRCTTPFEQGLLLGISISVLVMVITGLAESNRGYTMQQLYFWMLMGLGVAVIRLRSQRTAGGRES